LPALLQNYSEDLSSELLGKTLEICATLQNSKTTAVANTAAATLQQLVIAAFEKVSREDGQFYFPVLIDFFPNGVLTSTRKAPGFRCRGDSKY
jgi:Mon2-like cyclophilin-binding protein